VFGVTRATDDSNPNLGIAWHADDDVFVWPSFSRVWTGGRPFVVLERKLQPSLVGSRCLVPANDEQRVDTIVNCNVDLAHEAVTIRQAAFVRGASSGGHIRDVTRRTTSTDCSLTGLTAVRTRPVTTLV